MRIIEAGPEDLPVILALQKLAFLSEALLLDDFAIPPLRETLEDMRGQLAQGTIVLKGVLDARIMGSVRGRIENGTMHVGKLMVHPDYQGRGYGTRLLAAVESRHRGPRCELFTSAASTANLRLYEQAGYVRFREQRMDSGLVLVFLEKFLRGQTPTLPIK